MPTPFDSIDVKKAVDIVALNRTKGRDGRDWYAENKLFIGYTTDEEPRDIDHWQKGNGFVCPMPEPEHPDYTTIVTGWKSAFVTENVMGEMAARRLNGVLGRAPEYRFEFEGIEDLADEELPEADRAKRERLEQLNERIREWFKNKKSLRVLRKFQMGLTAGAKSYLRIYVPSERFRVERPVLDEDGDVVLNESGQPVTETTYDFGADTPEEALRSIYVECVDRDTANLIVHKPTMRQVGVIAFEVKESDVLGGSRKGDKWAEVTFLDENGLTVQKVVYSGDQPSLEVRVDLGGRLTLFEGNEALYLDEGIRSNQRDLNTTRTQLRIANDNTAFTRLIVTNAQPPTTEETDPVSGKKRLVVGEETGPGKVTYAAGYKFMGEDGKIYITNPGVHEIQPPNNEGLIRSANEARSSLYRLGKQAHMMIAGDATASGESRIQAQSDFLVDLADCKSIIDEAGKWMIETVWWFANHLAGTQVDEGLKGVFEAKLDPGHISEGLRRHILERVDKGLLSKRMAMAMLGTDDVEAELQQIRREREEDQPELESLQIERARIAIERERGVDADEIEQRRRAIEAAAGGA